MDKTAIVLSIHTSIDNRINKQILSIVKDGYSVIYMNSFEDDNTPNLQNTVHYNVKEKFSKSNIKGVIRAFSKMKALLKQQSNNAQIVHFHDAILLPLSYSAKRFGLKVVYDRHESYNVIGGVIGKLSAFFERHYMKYIDAVVYVADMHREYLSQIGYRTMIHVPNYQSIEIYQKNNLRKRDDNKVQLVYFGMISDSSRDISKMLNIMEKLMQSHDNVQCIIGGKIDGDYLDERIKKLNDTYNSFQYCGVLKYQEVVEKTINADIGVYFQKNVPNNIGSSPNKIYEYLMAGLVVFAQGKFSDWETIDGNAGYVFSFESVEEDMYKKIERIIINQDMLNEFKVKSKELSYQFSWESIEDRYRNLYRDLLTNSN